MRVLFLLFCITLARTPSGGTCTRTDWFWYNINQLITTPIRNRLSYVVDVPYYAPRAEPDGYKLPPGAKVPKSGSFEQRCPEVGIHNGLDILVVGVKYGTGINLLSSLLVSERLYHGLPLLDACSVTTTRADVAISRHHRLSEQCEYATQLFLCAGYFWRLALPWLFGLIVLGFISFGGVFLCCLNMCCRASQ